MPEENVSLLMRFTKIFMIKLPCDQSSFPSPQSAIYHQAVKQHSTSVIHHIRQLNRLKFLPTTSFQQVFPQYLQGLQKIGHHRRLFSFQVQHLGQTLN